MGKKKDKKKKSKKKKKDGEKKPSLKSKLEAKIAELDTTLATTSKHLEEHQSSLESWKTLLAEEVSDGQACVSHLRRGLQAKAEEGVGVQGRLIRLRKGVEEIAELDATLSTTSKHLEEHQSSLESWKTLLAEEVSDGQACVSHLRRGLEAKAEEGVDVQGRLIRLREMVKEVGRKVDEMKAILEAERETERGEFRRRHTEMEDKLSGLELKRQKRLRQLAYIKKVEEALRNKTTAGLNKDRQENMQEVEELLRRRSKFIELVDNITADHEEVFKINLPVYAAEQVRDNIKFRTDCQDAAEDLLSTQDRHRHLKDRREELQVKSEIQDSAEKDLKSLAKDTVDRLDEMLRGKDVHRPIEREYMEIMEMEIGEMETQMENLQDEMDSVRETMGDGDGYMKTLEKEIERMIDLNGLLTSKILRASQVFKGRLNENHDAIDKKNMDIRVLQQIKMILEDK